MCTVLRPDARRKYKMQINLTFILSTKREVSVMPAMPPELRNSHTEAKLAAIN